MPPIAAKKKKIMFRFSVLWFNKIILLSHTNKSLYITYTYRREKEYLNLILNYIYCTQVYESNNFLILKIKKYSAPQRTNFISEKYSNKKQEFKFSPLKLGNNSLWGNSELFYQTTVKYPHLYAGYVFCLASNEGIP